MQNNLAAYYLVPILQSAGITSYTNILGISAGLSGTLFFACVAGAQSFERWGRRPTVFLSTIGTILFFIITTGLTVGCPQ